MPQQTFLNLSAERQREILEVCLEEFARHDYRDVSLTRIIDRLGLAKGSFYRYFLSKKGLYSYLIEYAVQHTRGLFEEIFSDPEDDILDAWVHFYLACAERDNADPLLGYFGYRVVREQHNVVLGDVPRRALQRGFELLGDLVSGQQQAGKIRSDVGAQRLVYVLVQVQNGFLDYLTLTHDIDFEANVRESRPLFTIPLTVLKQELEAFADILRHGFLPPSTGGGCGRSIAQPESRDSSAGAASSASP